MEKSEKLSGVKVGLCTWCDHDQCHIKCMVENGRLIGTEDFPESPFQPWFGVNQCAKMSHRLVEQLYHPDRLNYPLKRVGNRGENRWKEISWENALDEIAEKLSKLKQTYGPETMGVIFGSPFDQWTVSRFCNVFGTPNTDSSDARICGGIEMWMNFITYGGTAHYAPADPLRTELLVLWGAQPKKSEPIKWARDRRVPKIVVIDPRKIGESDQAVMWLQIRPGTDAALALGWLNVIINEGLYDKEFIDKWTFGFDKLKERVQEYPPKKVSEITWIPEKEIVDSARLYGTVKPAHIQWGSPPSYVGYNAGEIERARCCLRAVTGNLDICGGSSIIKPFSRVHRVTTMELAELLPDEQVHKALGSDRFRAMTWPGFEIVPDTVKMAVRKGVVRGAVATAILHAARTEKPHPIKALFTSGTNLMMVHPNTKHIYEAIMNTELHVHCDHWMVPNAVLADYVMPIAMWPERPVMGLQIEYPNCLITGEQVVPNNVDPTKSDRRYDYDFWRGLGLRFGYEKHWPWKTLEQAYDYMLEPMGMSFSEFAGSRRWEGERIVHKRYEKEGGFATPTGKVELYSTVLEKTGYDPLPYYEEPPESPYRTPELFKEYPYIFISRRSPVFIHSSQRMIKGMRKMHLEPYIRMHPETAKQNGINEGDWVWVESKRGKIRLKCQFDDKFFKEVVAGDFGWWFPEKPAEAPSLFGVFESNINVLSPDDLEFHSRSSGSWVLDKFLVKISKVQ